MSHYTYYSFIDVYRRNATADRTENSQLLSITSNANRSGCSWNRGYRWIVRSDNERAINKMKESGMAFSEPKLGSLLDCVGHPHPLFQLEKSKHLLIKLNNLSALNTAWFGMDLMQSIGPGLHTFHLILLVLVLLSIVIGSALFSLVLATVT